MRDIFLAFRNVLKTSVAAEMRNINFQRQGCISLSFKIKDESNKSNGVEEKPVRFFSTV